MTIQERADIAAGLKAHGERNCCQAVLEVFADKMDLSEEQLLRLASPFAAGMGCMEATCGALIGAGLASGLLTSGLGGAKVSRAILALFREKCGATICKELKAKDSETGKSLCECPDCVRNAVLALGEVLEIE